MTDSRQHTRVEIAVSPITLEYSWHDDRGQVKGHAGLAAGRWATLTLAEQMANVGSEVDRAIAAWEAQRSDRFDRALARALELFDLTAADPRWSGPRRREILRAREEFCRLFFEPPAPPRAAATIRSYFLQFAVPARRASDVPA